MSSVENDVLDLSDVNGDSEFSGFESGDIVDTPYVASMVEVSTVTTKEKRGKSPVKGKKKVKSVVKKASKPVSRNQTPTNKSKKLPLSSIDINQLSKEDIVKLRQKLGIPDVDPHYYDTFDEYSYQEVDRPNLHVQINSEDVSDTETPGPSRSKNIEEELFGSVTSEDENWQPPKLKALETDKPIAKSLAKLINVACTSQCDIEEIAKKYKIPENVDMAGPPLVNPEIWKILDKRVHTQDRGLAEIQNIVATAMEPVIKIAENLKSAALNQGTKTLLSDTLTLLGQVQYNISVKRRYSIRPHLKKKYFGLCNISMPITKNLFGDDVSKEIKSCDSMAYIAKDSQYGSYKPWRGRGTNRPFRRGYSGNYRFQPYPVQRGNFSRPFRARAGRVGAISAYPNDK